MIYLRNLIYLKKNANSTLAKTYMRQYPTIFISFAITGDDSSKENIITPDWSKIKGLIIGRIAKLFSEFNYIAQYLKKKVDKKFNQVLDQKIYEYKKRFNVEKIPDNIAEEIYKQVIQDQTSVQSIFLEQKELEKFVRLSQGEPKNEAELLESINFLAELLSKFHNKPTYILVDEYDNLINKYFDNQEILIKLTSTFSGIFSAFAKPIGIINDHIQKVIFTGILRVAKANIFSSLNNLREFTVLDEKFSEYYGFLEEEVNMLLDKAKIINLKGIKNWYNGYTIGQQIIYNPWSIMRCIDNNGNLEAYWVDTADRSIIRNLLVERSSIEYKIKIRNLIKNNQAELEFKLKKHVSFDDINYNTEILWSVLVHTGYLTLVQDGDKQHVRLRLPNEEIKQLITEYVDNWFTTNTFLSKAANSLLIGDLLNFKQALTEILNNPVYNPRIFSGGGKSANNLENINLKEFIYQFLIMTELRCFNIDPDSKNYEVMCEPNNVSLRKTRPDFLVVNHKLKLCIIGELKVSNQPKEDLEELAKNAALAQIDKNKYGHKYKELGYQLIKLGIAFKGNKFGFVIG